MKSRTKEEVEAGAGASCRFPTGTELVSLKDVVIAP